MNWGMPPILSEFNRFQLEDGFIKHAQLAVSVGAGQAGAEVHGLGFGLRSVRLASGSASGQDFPRFFITGFFGNQHGSRGRSYGSWG